MKKIVWLGVLVSLAVVVTAFLVLHRRAAPLTSAPAASPGTQWSIGDQWKSMDGIPAADEGDYVAYKKTPEFQALQPKIMKILSVVEAHGGPTADEAEMAINCMHSPYYNMRRVGAVIAGYARFEPARSVLLPHVVGLLSDRASVVRLFAADSLGKMGDNSVKPSLKPLLKDPIPLVARAAQEAISKLQSQKETVPEK